MNQQAQERVQLEMMADLQFASYTSCNELVGESASVERFVNCIQKYNQMIPIVGEAAQQSQN